MFSAADCFYACNHDSMTYVLQHAFHHPIIRIGLSVVTLHFFIFFCHVQHLTQQQGALAQLVKVIKEDMEDLQCIEEGLHQT